MQPLFSRSDSSPLPITIEIRVLLAIVPEGLPSLSLSPTFVFFFEIRFANKALFASSEAQWVLFPSTRAITLLA